MVLFFAWLGVIVENDEYTLDEITAYTNSLLLCSEMIIVGFLQYLIFPVEDYDTSVDYRKTLKSGNHYTRLVEPSS